MTLAVAGSRVCRDLTNQKYSVSPFEAESLMAFCIFLSPLVGKGPLGNDWMLTIPSV